MEYPIICERCLHGAGRKRSETPVALDRTKRFIIFQEVFTCLQQHRVMFHHQVVGRGLVPISVQRVTGIRTDGAALISP